MSGFLTAQDIISAICSVSLAEMGIGQHKIDALTGVSLAEMLAAKAEVERDNEAAVPVDGTKSFSIVPDDRLIAAVYALLHYAVPPYHTPGDNDDAAVHVVINGHRHGLVKWVRPA